jgi:peptidoglycan hydrolase-like protein with peptidoglycan-binding domain
MQTLKEGSSGPDVTALQQRLQAAGFDPGKVDGEFGPGTEAAVMAFQKSEGLVPDGVAGPRTLAALGLAPAGAPDSAGEDVTARVTVNQVSKMCPGAPLGSIKRHLPEVLRALRERGLGDKAMVLMAIATIRAETAGFEPISELKSRFNTSPNGHPFDLYDARKDLGNRGQPDGAAFKGRGFVQLTGRANYERFSARLGLGDRLVHHPELANDPQHAADILAAFLKDEEGRIREALAEGDLAAARKRVNGGSHGLGPFSEAYRVGDAIIA